MNLVTIEIRDIILRELEMIRGKRMQLLNSSTTFELEHASSESIYLRRYVGVDGSYHIADIGRVFWSIIRRIEIDGIFEFGGTAYPGSLAAKYVITLLKNMPTLFEVESNMLTGKEVARFVSKTTSEVAASINVKSEPRDEDKCRVTAIVGAGAAIGLGDSNRVTTKYITDQLLEQTEKGTQELLETIKRNLPEKYKNNFENYFYVVEQLVTFDRDWLDETHTYTHPFSPFINPRKVKPRKDKARPRNVLLKMYLQLMDTINQYDEYFRKEIEGKLKWYSDFWRDSKDFYWDIFTFNYDTTIEKCLEGSCTDGYVDNGVETQSFSPVRYLSEFSENKKHTINHVHGCLLYSGDTPRYKIDEDIQAVYSHNQRKWKTYQENKSFLAQKSISRGLGQSGEFLAQDSIITGLHKTDKIVCHPYAFYRAQLDKRLIDNNRLLIVGYSFNDFYINIMLESLTMYHENYKVVLIDYISPDDADIEQNKDNALGEYFQQNEEKKYMLHFIEAIVTKSESKSEDNVWSMFNYDTVKEKYIVSIDEKVMFFYGGFKEASSYKETIYKFVTEDM